MSVHKAFICETCGALTDRLYQSYVSGAMECAPCALDDPFMSAEQRAGIVRRMKRSEQARKNFRHEHKAAA